MSRKSRRGSERKREELGHKRGRRDWLRSLQRGKHREESRVWIATRRTNHLLRRQAQSKRSLAFRVGLEARQAPS